MMMKYPEIIKALREDRDITQKQLGDIFNVNQITISQYERGTRQLSIDMLEKYARFFQVSTDYILGLTKDPRPNWNVTNKIKIQNNSFGNINIKL